MGTLSMPSVMLNVVITVMSVGSWLMLVFGVGSSRKLADTGVESLKYFTVLSNLFSGLASALYLIVCGVMGAPLPLWLAVTKCEAAAAVMLTLVTVIVLLTPMYGWKSMYMGGNLWMHLVLPLLAALDCVACVRVGALPFWTTLCAMIPTAAYGVGYIDALRRHGAEDNGKVYDFYGFLRWGEEKIGAVFACMLLATWVIALVLHLVSNLAFV